jgi:hypothetical protein
MTLLFLLLLALLGFGMKFVILLLPSASMTTRWSFILSPFVTPDMLDRWVPAGEWRRIYSQCAASLVALALSYWGYWMLVEDVRVRGILLSYLAVPILLLAGQPLVAIPSLIWLPTDRLWPPLHNNPLLSRGLADFWGHRWNLWFSRWFRLAIFNRMRSRPKCSVIVVFFVSGVMHEWVINLLLYLVTGRNLFGSMMIYFLLNGAGVLFENKYLKRHPKTRVVFVWMIVAGPIPLMLNEGMLRVLHLWP